MSNVNPAVKPGGATFPVFTGSTQWRAFPWGNMGEELVIAIQFDFSASNPPMYQTVANGLNYNNFQVDPRPYFGTRPPRSMKSLLISADFSPQAAVAAPYPPIMVQESSMGQLCYLGNGLNNAREAVIAIGGKACACFDLLSQPGAVFAFTQGEMAQSGGGTIASNVAAGTAFLTTFRMQPFVFAQSS